MKKSKEINCRKSQKSKQITSGSDHAQAEKSTGQRNRCPVCFKGRPSESAAVRYAKASIYPLELVDPHFVRATPCHVVSAIVRRAGYHEREISVGRFRCGIIPVERYLHCGEILLIFRDCQRSKAQYGTLLDRRYGAGVPHSCRCTTESRCNGVLCIPIHHSNVYTHRVLIAVQCLII